MTAELATSAEATPGDRLLQAESLVRDWCGWHIAPSRTETATFGVYDLGDPEVLLLPTLHLTDVSSVTVVGGDAVDPAAYTWHAAGVIRRIGYRSWITATGWAFDYTEDTAPAQLTVAFTHGYSTPPPAVTAIVQAVAQRAIANPGSLVREHIGPFADYYSQTAMNQAASVALLDVERDVLAPYRLPKRP